MARTTVQDAINQVARNISLVNGDGMTPYSPDLIESYLDGAHQFIKDEQEWHDFDVVYNRTLDGSTGLITEGITGISDAREITRIYHTSSMTPLPKVSLYNNKQVSTSLIGYEYLNREDDPGPSFKLVRFYPLILTGDVRIEGHKTFDFTDRNLVIPVDWWLHVYHASWQFALDDGTNPGQIAKYETMFNTRLKQVKEKENNKPISLDPYAAIPDIWFEGDDPYWISGR